MKTTYVTILFLCFTYFGFSQDFTLKKPDLKILSEELSKSEYSINVILSYLERNYKATTEKIDILKDAEMGNVECGFTKKFEPGIVYTYNNCGEAAPVKELISFPKIKSDQLQKWIEEIHSINPSKIINTWYKGENEYGPKDEGVGCYYKIKQSKNNSVVDIFCGC